MHGGGRLGGELRRRPRRGLGDCVAGGMYAFSLGGSLSAREPWRARNDNAKLSSLPAWLFLAVRDDGIKHRERWLGIYA